MKISQKKNLLNLILANLNLNIHFWLYIPSQKTKGLHMTLECRDTKIWPIIGWHPLVSTLKGGKGRAPPQKTLKKKRSKWISPLYLAATSKNLRKLGVALSPWLAFTSAAFSPFLLLSLFSSSLLARGFCRNWRFLSSHTASSCSRNESRTFVSAFACCCRV